MRKTNTEKIDKVMEAAFRQMGISHRMKEMRVINMWHEIIGTNIARCTKSINIYNRVLFITMTSATVKNELSMLKTAIVDAVNNKAGEKLIDDIVIR